MLNLRRMWAHKLQGWKARVLSQAGHTVLIKRVTTAMPFYDMSSFLLPKSSCSDLDRMFKDFCWGFDPNKTRNFTPKAWAAICHPKEKGGLELHLMFDSNLALITKMGWNLYAQPNSPWVHALKAKYTNDRQLHCASARTSSS